MIVSERLSTHSETWTDGNHSISFPEFRDRLVQLGIDETATEALEKLSSRWTPTRTVQLGTGAE